MTKAQCSMRRDDDDHEQEATDSRPLRSVLSLENGASDFSSHGAEGEIPHDLRMLRIIESIHDRTIRPGRLALELGISVEDASAELCGLLAAVGGGSDGASFRFERLPTSHEASSPSATTMVFSFPPDFQRRALRRRRKDDFRAIMLRVLIFACKTLKVVVAFGLVMSLLILTFAAAVGVVAAMIALLRVEGGHRQRSALWNQMRALFFTVRQLLWCFAVFGPSIESDDGNQDPFFREVAYDVWLFCSICCGSPGSIWFWMRASQLQQRRSRVGRSWGQASRYLSDSTTASTYNADDVLSGQARRGLVSSLVEFLFGPTPFAPRPLASDIWTLRSAALVELSTRNKAAGSTVSLEEIAPYVDFPPYSITDSARIVEQGLLIVAHFNGIPANEQHDGSDTDNDPVKAKFCFPELLSESSTAKRFEHAVDNDDGSWEMLLALKPEVSAELRSNGVPSHLKEERYKFTRLAPKQLVYCVFLGGLNLLGVYWLGYSVSPNGFLEVDPTLAAALSGLLGVLKFYAVLYFAIPGLRLLLILFLNSTRHQRNTKRARLVARNLGSESGSTRIPVV